MRRLGICLALLSWALASLAWGLNAALIDTRWESAAWRICLGLGMLLMAVPRPKPRVYKPLPAGLPPAIAAGFQANLERIRACRHEDLRTRSALEAWADATTYTLRCACGLAMSAEVAQPAGEPMRTGTNQPEPKPANLDTPDHFTNLRTATSPLDSPASSSDPVPTSAPPTP